MSTHAVYHLWSGFLEHKNIDEVPEPLYEFLKEVRRTYLGVEREGLLFRAIPMHGTTLGYGVVISSLNWITDDDTPESPDLELLAKLPEKLQQVRDAFTRIGLPESVPCNLYHHLDLGG